jgi:hypothetical protein
VLGLSGAESLSDLRRTDKMRKLIAIAAFALLSSLGWANHQMGPKANKNSPNIIIKSGVE